MNDSSIELLWRGLSWPDTVGPGRAILLIRRIE